jgi:hypothetical protein
MEAERNPPPCAKGKTKVACRRVINLSCHFVVILNKVKQPE